MTVNIDSFRSIVNKHDKIDNNLLKEKLNVVRSDTGSYAYLSECVADGDPANFQGLKESESGEFIEQGEHTYTINYDSAVIAFAEDFTIPNTLYAYYWGGGSIIWADDVTSLQEACNTIHNNTLYKDGSVALTGNLNVNGNKLINVSTVNNISIQNHAHLGQAIDGTVQLGDDSISELSMSKVVGLQSALNNKENKLPTYQSGKFLTNNGNAVSWGNPYTRNIGEVVQSMLPLNDPKLHLLNGDCLPTTSYSDLNSYMLTNSTATQYPSGVGIIGSLQNSNHVLSGFSTSSYAQIPITFAPVDEPWEIQVKFNYKRPASVNGHSSYYQDLISPEVSDSQFVYYVYTYNSGNSMIIRADMRFTIDGSVYYRTYTISYELADSTDYWIKTGSDDNVRLYFKISTDGENYTTIFDSRIEPSQIYTTNVEFPIFNKSFLNLGINPHAANTLYPWLGSIDLKECYIKVSDTILWQGGVTLNKLNADFLLDEGLWQSYKYKYGVCGKFVYDAVNKTIRLPKANSILQGSIAPSHAGDIIEAGLPNITGSPILGEASSSWSKMPPISGAIYRASTSANKYAGASDSDNDYLAFDASRSNSIYGNSNTVQPQTIKALNYMVVAK